MDSFLNLNPKIEIILNIDSDHLDYFKDIEHIASSFDKFANLVPENGTVIAFDANPFVNSIIDDLDSRVITFGFNERCGYYATDIEFDSAGMRPFRSIMTEKLSAPCSFPYPESIISPMLWLLLHAVIASVYPWNQSFRHWNPIREPREDLTLSGLPETASPLWTTTRIIRRKSKRP
jgi:hypothetical protein